VTLLGYPNPARRIVGAVRGLVRRPRGSARRRPVAVVGHRRAAREAPENTLASFAKAIHLGADAIETDVCVTRDGHFVLWHDCRPDDKVALLGELSEDEIAILPDEEATERLTSVREWGSGPRRPL
jgi:glycerophosphoryl diester phosphodiesterase